MRAFLVEGRVNQKRLDAIAMLRSMKERFARDPSPKQVRWHFEHTDSWETVRRAVAAREPG